MEELIEILINLIASFFQNKPVKPQLRLTQTPPPTPPPLPGGPVLKKTNPRRGGPRRPLPPSVAIAEPILLATSAPPAPVKQIARASTAHTGIEANVIPNQSAAALRKWLKPVTLKNQFLLTEILQPPLALRDNRSPF